MSISDEIIELTSKIEQLLVMLEVLEKRGDRKASLFADGVRRRLNALRKEGSSEAGMRVAMLLLDIVPSGKDLDAIDFRLDLHPEIAAISSAIEEDGARIAKPLIDAI